MMKRLRWSNKIFGLQCERDSFLESFIFENQKKREIANVLTEKLFEEFDMHVFLRRIFRN